MLPEHRARLLEQLGTLRTGVHRSADAQLTAVVLAVLEGGLFPSDVLGLRVRDAVRLHNGDASRWEIRPAIDVRGLARVLPLNVRAAWLMHVAHSVAAGRFTRLDESPLFRGERGTGALSRRTLLYQFQALLSRAELPPMTLHALRRQAPEPIARLAQAPKPGRAHSRKPRRKKAGAAQSTTAPTGTELTPLASVAAPDAPAGASLAVARNEADHELDPP